ncbi:DUF2922 domain-containing protein [Selenomonas bovis]|uniref:DUF2922 domain-containing protein n=1 Tax=Selenomonas bovis TaxID=416586 RepID=A0A848BB66_9FIRM|nr:DUF2922 domain-containing protein [Selenomonas bovis]NMD99652.1 DUF2922 domain-containing protein [Selenomonas bovis]
MAKSLKMIFQTEAGKTATLSLAEPKDGLTKAEVQTVVDEMVAKKAVVIGSAAATGVKEFYVQNSERVELA